MKPYDRRRFVKNSATAAALVASRRILAGAEPAQFAYVGCYTTKERAGHGDGIHAYRMDPQTGALTHFQHLGELVNPSFLVASHGQRFLYSVHGDENYATAFSIDRASGNLKLLNRAATGGSNGVHMAFDPSDRFMVMANYASGSVAVLPVRRDGSLQDFSQLIELKGERGPHRVEQAGSHPHHVVFDPSGKFVLVPDKGLDRIFIFRFDGGKLTEHATAAARSGYGPRHLAFHPTLHVVWVLDELGSAMTTYRWNPERGEMHAEQILPSIPSDFTGNNTGAEIAVSAGGRFVYGSNRGHNSIAMYSSDPETGLLTSIGWQPTEGMEPRFIGFDVSRRFLYAANQSSDTVVAFRADPRTGRLTPAGQTVRNASPVTIAFVT